MSLLRELDGRRLASPFPEFCSLFVLIKVQLLKRGVKHGTEICD